MKKWWWLWLLAAVFFVNGIWALVRADETSLVTTRDIPSRDILEDFGDVIGLWADEQEFFDIEKLDIDCEIENLLVETETTVANQQAYNTIFLTIHMYITADPDMEYLYTDYQEVQEELRTALEKSPYYKYVRTQTMNYYRADNENFMFSTSFDKSTVFRHGSTGVKQERKERKVQAIAYNYADKLGTLEFDDGTGTKRQYGFAQLTHFGVEKNSTELYVEIEIPTNHKEHLEAFRASLQHHADTLQKELMENRTARKYMNEKNVDTVTIVFHTHWDAEMEDHIYQYSVDE